jgi:hypothetical protein
LRIDQPRAGGDQPGPGGRRWGDHSRDRDDGGGGGDGVDGRVRDRPEDRDPLAGLVKREGQLESELKQHSRELLNPKIQPQDRVDRLFEVANGYDQSGMHVDPPDWSSVENRLREAEEAYGNGNHASSDASQQNQRADLQRGRALLREQIGELAVRHGDVRRGNERLTRELLHPDQDQPSDPPELSLWRARARISDSLGYDRRKGFDADERTLTEEAKAVAAAFRAQGMDGEAAGTLLHIATKAALRRNPHQREAALRRDPHLESTVTEMLRQAVVDARQDGDRYLEAMASYNHAVLPGVFATGRPNWTEIRGAEAMLGKIGSPRAVAVGGEATAQSPLFGDAFPWILTVELPDLWYRRTSEES